MREFYFSGTKKASRKSCRKQTYVDTTPSEIFRQDRLLLPFRRTSNPDISLAISPYFVGGTTPTEHARFDLRWFVVEDAHASHARADGSGISAAAPNFLGAGFFNPISSLDGTITDHVGRQR